MDDLETKMATALHADVVDLSHIASSKTVNGEAQEPEVYLQCIIVNSKSLDSLSENKTMLDEKLAGVRDFVLEAAPNTKFPPFNQVRIKVVRDNSFLVFKSESSRTVTYDVN